MKREFVLASFLLLAHEAAFAQDVRFASPKEIAADALLEARLVLLFRIALGVWIAGWVGAGLATWRNRSRSANEDCERARSSLQRELRSGLGGIRSLGFEGDEDELLSRVDPLFEDVLRGVLIADASLREHVLELFHTRVETSAGIGAPEGLNDLGAALVCTELRLVLLTRFIYSVPETNVVVAEVRRVGLPFESLSAMILHETGRWRPQYKLEVRTRSGQTFVAGIKRTSIRENGTFNGCLAFALGFGRAPSVLATALPRTKCMASRPASWPRGALAGRHSGLPWLRWPRSSSCN